MILHKITLAVQTTPTAKAQPYKGPHIMEVLDIQILGDRPTLLVLADPSIEQTCDQFVQRLEQPLDPSTRSPSGDPLDQGNSPVVLHSPSGAKIFATRFGPVIVRSYCFA